MTIEAFSGGGSFVYQPGLSRTRETVVSSHFMRDLCGDSHLALYDDDQFRAKLLTIPAEAMTGSLLPSLLRVAEAFGRDRASAAKRRALSYSDSYAVDPRRLGPAEFITEVMFDRQFRSSPRESCSRQEVRRQVARRIAAGAPIEMMIPALPYKFSCPLKTRGQSPDLAEVNFIIGLYEIVVAVETLYREAQPDMRGPLAKFTVISDGSRFNVLTNEPGSVIESYQRDLGRWIGKAGLAEYISIVDYQSLLRARLPDVDHHAKAALRERALRQYTDVMSRIFAPHDMVSTLRAAARHDLDPEASNREGRFVSLLKSLVFTIRYRSLEPFARLPAGQYLALYRELTAHIFEPFVDLPTAGVHRHTETNCGVFPFAPTAKERLRQAMLAEAWNATIGYMAEIKSDREQHSDPISSCLPDHLRWTIHAKAGQLGLLTPSALGKLVLPWAGSAVFKCAKGGGIRLCTLPVLVLEGRGAIPVGIECNDGLRRVSQPLFYIYPDVSFAGLDDFLVNLPSRLMRKRAS